MRDIIFQGKEKKPNGLELWRVGWIHKFNNDPNNNDPIIFSEDGSISCAVYAETVGQYAGSRDRRGKRIFEGDVIKRSGPKGGRAGDYLATFKDGAFTLTPMEDPRFGCRRPFPLFQDWREIQAEGMVYKITGNIFDYPELLLM